MREKEILDARMRAAGMATIDEMVASLNESPLMLQKEVVDLETFEKWLECEYRVYVSMQARKQLDKSDDDDMFEWVLAHAALYGKVLGNLRKAMGK